MVKNILDANGQLKNLETGEIYELEVEGVQVQKLDEFIRIQTNENATQYKAEAVINATTTHTQSGSKSDDSLSLTVYATIYYTSYSKNNFTYVGIDKIDYRFDLQDRSVTVSNKRILVSQNGVGYSNGGKAITNQKDTLNAYDSDTILVRNWGWDAVLKNGLAYTCGINITATLQRGTHSHWDFLFNFQVT
ncbi:hypothetical protein YSY43_45520 [Paenibacillus sp. YSY-4.3]